MKNYSAVFFDFDGVIANTGEDNFAAWNFAFAPFGIQIDRRTCFTLEGMRVSDLARKVLVDHGQDPKLHLEVAQRKDMRYAEVNSFKFFDGVPEILAALKAQGVKAGLVSGGSKHRLFANGGEHIFKLFDVIITAEDVPVGRGKPLPDPYLMAAKKVGVMPEKCVVIENAPLGVKSAKAAGMYCVAVCTTLPKEELDGADQIVPGLRDASKVIGV